MSETTGTVIKLLAALTSPKASIKYISMAIFLVISWKYLNEKLVTYGAPAEHLSLIVLLIGLGAGSLVGQAIYGVIAFGWSKVEKKISAHKDKKTKTAIDAQTLLANNQAKNALLTTFKTVYEHYPYWKKDTLRRLVGGSQRLESDLDHVHTLKTNRYILKVANVDSESDIYEINPAISEYVDRHWQLEIERNMSDFFDNLTSEKQHLIEVMTYTGTEFCGPINLATVQLVKPIHPCFEIECEDENGFWISFRHPYNSHFAEKTGVHFKDELYIRHDWIN